MRVLFLGQAMTPLINPVAFHARGVDGERKFFVATDATGGRLGKELVEAPHDSPLGKAIKWWATEPSFDVVQLHQAMTASKPEAQPEPSDDQDTLFAERLERIVHYIEQAQNRISQADPRAWFLLQKACWFAKSPEPSATPVAKQPEPAPEQASPPTVDARYQVDGPCRSEVGHIAVARYFAIVTQDDKLALHQRYSSNQGRWLWQLGDLLDHQPFAHDPSRIVDKLNSGSLAKDCEGPDFRSDQRFKAVQVESTFRDVATVKQPEPKPVPAPPTFAAEVAEAISSHRYPDSGSVRLIERRVALVNHRGEVVQRGGHHAGFRTVCDETGQSRVHPDVYLFRGVGWSSRQRAQEAIAADPVLQQLVADGFRVAEVVVATVDPGRAAASAGSAVAP